MSLMCEPNALKSKITFLVNDYYNKIPKTERAIANPQPGTPVVAFQGEWYRGVVKSRSEKSVTVYFVDFGNTDEVS